MRKWHQVDWNCKLHVGNGGNAGKIKFYVREVKGTVKLTTCRGAGGSAAANGKGGDGKWRRLCVLHQVRYRMRVRYAIVHWIIRLKTHLYKVDSIWIKIVRNSGDNINYLQMCALFRLTLQHFYICIFKLFTSDQANPVQMRLQSFYSAALVNSKQDDF